jgi:hypothetical protein
MAICRAAKDEMSKQQVTLALLPDKHELEQSYLRTWELGCFLGAKPLPHVLAEELPSGIKPPARASDAYAVENTAYATPQASTFYSVPLEILC